VALEHISWRAAYTTSASRYGNFGDNRVPRVPSCMPSHAVTQQQSEGLQRVMKEQSLPEKHSAFQASFQASLPIKRYRTDSQIRQRACGACEHSLAFAMLTTCSALNP